MNALYFMVPFALLLSFGFIGAFIWATQTGQWDDLDLTPKNILLDSTVLEEKHETTK